MIQETQIPDKLRTATILLVLLTPGFTNLVQHAGSVIILLLALLGLYVFHQQGRITYAKREKKIMAVFVIYFLFSLVISAIHNISNWIPFLKGGFEHPFRMLAILPIYYLFIQVR